MVGVQTIRKSSPKRLRAQGTRDSRKSTSKMSPQPHSAQTAEPCLRAMLGAVFPSPSEVCKLPTEVQEGFVERAAKLCEKAIYCIDAGVAQLSTSGRRESGTASAASGRIAAVEDAVLADMVRFREVPVAREFVGMTLWRRLRNANEQAVVSVREACAEIIAHCENDASIKRSDTENVRIPRSFASFKQAHMRTMTENFAADLERLRSIEAMDGEKVQFLVRCLEAGADLAASLSTSDWSNCIREL
jgi:Ribosome-assembly protein 3